MRNVIFQLINFLQGVKERFTWGDHATKFSPFAITRGQKDNKEKPAFSELNNRSRDSSKSRKLKRWLSMVTLTRKRVLLPVEKLRTSLLANSKLHRTLYGFVVFEVAWDDVRGINYVNELQTYTSLAIESKYMKRWEFDSIAQAAKGLMSWFPGTPYEALLLEHRLNSMIGEAFHEAGTESPSTCGSSDDEKILNDGVLLEDVSPCNRSSNPNDQIETLEVQDQSSLPNTPPSIANTPPSIANTPPSIASTPPSITNTPPSHTTTNQIIPLDMNELDNECGSNVSYSGNASYHIPSPCPSECMEETEATQYTDVLLLFRFNDRDLPFELQKIVMSDLRLLTLLEAGLPSWVLFFQSYPVFCHMYRPWMCPLARALYVAMSFVTVVIGFYDLYKNVPVLKAAASRLFGPLFDWIETWDMITFFSSHTAISCPVSVDRVIDVLLLPVWYIASAICNFATVFMSPIFLCLWGAICAPIRFVLGLSSFVGCIYKYLYDVFGGIWMFVSSVLKVASSAEAATKHTYEVSLWRALWNDLFSQIFRATKSILYGVAAFFAACNRHRLSIYNHLLEFIRRLSQPVQRSELLYANTRLLKSESMSPPQAEPRERRPLPTKSTKLS
nr:G1/S-specific cyclin-E protein [Tanacetum cinerariifolium]